MSEFVDSVARARAESAHGKIEAHEDLCAERYSNIHDKLNSMTKLIGWGGATLATGVMGLVAFLSVRVMDAPDADKARLQAQVEILQSQLRPQSAETGSTVR